MTEVSRPTRRCPAWCGRSARHDVHVRRLGLADSVQVLLACLDAGDQPRLREPHVVLDPRPAVSGHTGAWVPVGEAAPLAAVVAQLGHPQLAGLLAAAARAVSAGGDS